MDYCDDGVEDEYGDEFGDEYGDEYDQVSDCRLPLQFILCFALVVVAIKIL